MPAVLKISTQDLDKLTPNDLEGVTGIVDQRGLYRPLDAAALQEKLRNIQRPSTSSSLTHTPSGTPSPDPELDAKLRRDDDKYYHNLIERGGRPAFSLQLWWDRYCDDQRTAWGYLDNYEQYEDIFKYWYRGGTGFRGQLRVWIHFQRFQQRNRKTAEIFDQYQRDVREYRRNEGIEGDIHLHFDPKQQTKVDEWKEYHYFQHRKLAGMRPRAEEARQRREKERREWEAVNGTGKKIDRSEPAGIAWIYRDKVEADLDDFMVLLNWIEQQLPEIARECAISNNNNAPKDTPKPVGPVEVSGTVPMLSAVSRTRRTARSNRRPTNGNKRSTSPVLGSVGAVRVAKASRKTKSSVHALVSGAQSTTHGDTRRITRAQNRASTATMNAIIQTYAQASADTAPLRRSRRIRDLEARRNGQCKMMPREARQKVSRAKSQRKPKERVSKERKLSPQARPQGITKSRVTRKKNLSRTAEQLDR
ncbi:hypothetical protein I7I51_03332 [Histoplasma capsulatum]|uniref:Uncharacterized protein n=1 Tax=Ajellomyces capsulatus TaxID=5037 RepID=A0A8A1M7A2_AJECA|nr:hypothetical protein I7I51_03332 [Histoplasma capsulatum]